MGVGAASGCYPKRTEVDKTTLVTRAPAAGVPALRAADAGKSAATPDVMCSTKRGGMGTFNVTTASIGLLVRSHRAGCPGGQRERCARKNKNEPSHHRLLRVVRAGLGDRSQKIEIGVGAARAMTPGGVVAGSPNLAGACCSRKHLVVLGVRRRKSGQSRCGYPVKKRHSVALEKGTRS